jgi:phage shock protein E
MCPSPKCTSAPDVRELVEQGGLLVDVRSPLEFDAGHLPGALNMPIEELESRLVELTDKHRAIVLYCRSGRRSALAAEQLRARGYSNVHDLGAMENWGRTS